jgi:AbrB family looped-hinge helix DNA binding protein
MSVMKSRQPTRVRETAPANHIEEDRHAGFQVVVADRGRVVLPAEVRGRLEIHDGDRLWLVVDSDGTIRIQTRAVIVRNMVGMFKHLSPQRSAVDELIAERRREAAMEERDTRERQAPGRRKKR